MVNHIFKTRMIPLVVVFCTILIPSLLKNLTSGNGISNSFFIITLMAFALYIYIFLHCGLKLKKIKNKLK